MCSLAMCESNCFQVCGFGYIGGQLVGLVADCGRLGSDEGQKGAHFMQLCDLRGVPLIFLQNNSSSTAYDDNYKVIKERSKFIQCQATARYESCKLKYSGGSKSQLRRPDTIQNSNILKFGF